MPTSNSTLVNSARVQNKTTQNGMTTNQTSLNNCVDMFFLVGASRNMREEEMIRVFISARAENPDMAHRILFWSRDIRGGAGERRFFNTIMKFVQEDNPFLFSELIQLVPEYGYWKDILNYPCDDVYELISNALIDDNSLFRHPDFKNLRDFDDNALNSQALLHLKKNYCDLNKCLHCAVGSYLISH